MVDPLTIAGLSLGAASAIGQAFGGGMDFEENRALMRESNLFNSHEAQKARDWSREMSNTAYQRSRADMEKAGLNPMLMAQQGGASTPGATSASAVAPPQTHRRQAALSSILSGAKDMMTTLAGIDKARAETKATDAQAAVNQVMAAKVVQDTKTSGATAKNLEVQNEALRAQAKIASNDAWRSGKLNEGMSNVVEMVDQASKKLFGSSAQSLKYIGTQNRERNYGPQNVGGDSFYEPRGSANKER